MLKQPDADSTATSLPPPVCLIIRPGEDRVLRSFLSDGAPNRMVGRRLNLSIDTVKAHLRNIMARLPIEYHSGSALCVGILRRRIIVRVLHARTDTKTLYVDELP